MKSFLNKIVKKIGFFFYGLIYGMKNTEDSILHQNGITNENGTSIMKEVESQRVSKALLRGEVTQEVEELRYRTYKVDKESREYEYYAPTLALKKSGQDKKDMKYDDSDGLELITIQPNDVIVETVFDTLQQVGGRGNGNDYRIKIKRDFVPRYKVEQYMTRIDVKRLSDCHVILDMYVSKYMNEMDFKSKGFIREIEKIRDEKIHSDILDYQEISFVTHHAYKIDDMVKFVFDNIWFKEIVEFDGHYILRFKARMSKDTIDLTKRYYSKTMADKYAKKEKKDNSCNLADYMAVKVYKCQECGKEVFFDNKMMDELNAYEGRDITQEKIDSDNPDVLEFVDMQISYQTFGKMLCSECMKKYLKKDNLI